MLPREADEGHGCVVEPLKGAHGTARRLKTCGYDGGRPLSGADNNGAVYGVDKICVVHGRYRPSL